jgi:hypothetical protein
VSLRELWFAEAETRRAIISEVVESYRHSSRGEDVDGRPDAASTSFRLLGGMIVDRIVKSLFRYLTVSLNV